ncbi:MAG: hypothetical protein J6V40_02010 [Clostridia bacterium]|nr:hypothetical protein [Clostridia bacterium]
MARTNGTRGCSATSKAQSNTTNTSSRASASRNTNESSKASASKKGCCKSNSKMCSCK